jgi:hypothetical protein
MNAKSGVNIDNSNRLNLAFISPNGSFQKPVIAVLSLVSTGIDIIIGPLSLPIVGLFLNKSS